MRENFQSWPSLVFNTNNIIMCLCKYCDREFVQPPKKGCVVCSSCSTTKRRWECRKELLELLGGKCTDCGFVGNPATLQFHHVDPTTKKYALYSRNLLRADRVEEAKKCIILCANCHIAHHTNKDLLKKMGILP